MSKGRGGDGKEREGELGRGWQGDRVGERRGEQSHTFSFLKVDSSA